MYTTGEFTYYGDKQAFCCILSMDAYTDKGDMIAVTVGAPRADKTKTPDPDCETRM